jgi:hypothetical protein
MSPVRYELGFISQETLFIVIAVRTSNLTCLHMIEYNSGRGLDG